MVYDITKTEELIKNIGEDLKVKDISKLLCKNIIGVRLNGRRGRMCTAINVKVLGLTNYSKEVEAFLSSNVRNTVINFFDKDVIKKFDNIINKSRQSLYKYSLTNDGSIYYMTEGNFLEFKTKFESTHLQEFKELREDLIKNLANYKKTFKEDLKKFMDTRDLDTKEADMIFKSIFNRFPSKEMLERDCGLDYYVIPFPVYNADDAAGLNAEILKKLDSDKDASAVEVFYNMVGGSLKQTFDLVYKCMEFVDDNSKAADLPMTFEVPSKTKGFINNTILKLAEDNKVMKNDNLMKILSVISQVFRDKTDKEGKSITNASATEIAEQLLGIIYSYSVYLGIDNLLTETVLLTEYTEEELLSIGEVADVNSLI